MDTKKALSILSKGEKDYSGRTSSQLVERSEQYLAEYAETDRKIAAQNNSDELVLPFLQSLRQKVSKMTNSPNEHLPIVARFDLYSGIRKLSERGNDSGMKRLSTQLEHAWHQDPMGTITYAQVVGLVKQYRDQYPRSKAADAIEAECARVGLHKLPVAKLARIAANINTQEDYDSSMESHGFASDRLEHVRARAMVRSLVSLRGTDMDPRINQASMPADLRSAQEKVADRIGQMGAPQMQEEEPKEPMAPEELMMEPAPMAPEMPGMEAPQEMVPAQDMLQEIEMATQEIVEEAPLTDPAVDNFLGMEEAEGHHTGPIGGPTWGAEEVLLEGHEAPPPSPEWMAEQVEQMGAPGEMPGEAPMAPPGAPPMMGGPKKPSPSPVQHGTGGFKGGSKTAKEEKGKAIPLPKGKIKEQHDMADNAGIKLPKKELKASEIEDKLLSGGVVKIGDFVIQINANDEVELWDKNAGRACDIDHLDTAIADFMAMVDNRIKRIEASKLKFSYKIAEIVHVPCEVCGEMSVFPKAASSDDAYGCDCGHEISAASVDELLKVAQSQRAYQMEVKYTLGQDPAQNKMARDRIMSAIQRFVPSVQINDEGRGFVVATAWNTDDAGMQNLDKNLKAMGATTESKRVADEKTAKLAQMPPPGGPPPALPDHGSQVKAEWEKPWEEEKEDGDEEKDDKKEPKDKKAQALGGAPSGALAAPAAPPAAAAAPPPTTPDMPPHDIINAALMHYKSMGLASGPGEALAQMYKDYKEREDLKSPENQLLAWTLAGQLYGAGAPAPAAGGAPAAPPEPSMGGAPGPVASRAAAESSKMKTPSIRRPKDHVKVDKDVGSDSETKEGVPSPGGEIKTQPNKEQHGKMSPKELGKDSGGQDLLPDAGKPKVTHSPTSQPGTKLPPKGLDKDSEPKSPFKTPAITKNH